MSNTDPTSPWKRRLPILCVVGLVLVPVGFRLVPQEIAAWHLANAFEKEAEKDYATAEASAQKSLQWNATSPVAYRFLAKLRHRESNEEEAMRFANLALQLNPVDFNNQVEHAQLLHLLGKHSEALAAWKKLQSAAVPASPSGLSKLLGKLMPADPRYIASMAANQINSLAYFRALANEEIDIALREMGPVVEFKDDAWNVGQRLDTRGFLHFQAGDYEAALKDLDPAVTLAEEVLASALDPKKPIIPDRDILNPRELQRAQASIKMAVAVIRYHRGLAHEKLGDSDLAKEDFQRVRELGHEPSPKLY